MSHAPRPPRLARWLLARLLPARHREYLLGDLEEEFAERHRRSALRARLWFWAQTLSTLAAYPRSSPLSSLVTDLRIALRGLRREPGFALVAVLTLAVGLGAVTSVFGMAHWVLLRPVPGVEAPDELVTVEIMNDEGDDTGISYLNLLDLTEGTPALSGLVGFQETTVQASGSGLAPASLRAQAVTDGYFELLGVGPARGRLFTSEELAIGSDARLAVLTHGAWTGRFGADPGVLGSTLRLNGTAFTLIGVTAPGFQGTERTSAIELFVPASSYAELVHIRTDYDETRRDFAFLMQAAARLAPGATAEEAQAQLQAVTDRLVAAYPDENELLGRYRPVVFEGIGTDFRERPVLERSVRMLFIVVSLILGIAAANVANLLLLRGLRREGATAVRRALGGSRWAVARLHLAESLALALPGALGALGVVWLLNRVVWKAGMPIAGPLPDLSITPATFGFAAVAATLATLVCGVAPALLAGRLRVADRLRGTATRGSTRATGWTRNGLTVLQLALSMALLVGATLVLRSLVNLRNVDPGIDASGVAVLTADPGPQGYSDEEDRAYWTGVRRAIATRPEVRSVTLSSARPFSLSRAWIRVGVEPEDEPVSVDVRFVADGYFELLGIPRIAGREFRADEIASGTAVEGVILNETLRRRLFGDGPAVGRTVALKGFRGDIRPTVIGVVADVRASDLREEAAPALYQPSSEALGSWRNVLVRGDGPVAGWLPAVERAMAEVDRNVPVGLAEPLTAGLDRALLMERTLLRLLLVVGGLAVVLAGVGLYSVVAYTVAQRTREIGIRVALGAGPARVARAVLRQTLALGVVGAAVGVGITVVLVRVLGSVLYGVGALDPAVLAAGAAFLVLMVVVAGGAPARRALRVDPVEAIRTE